MSERHRNFDSPAFPEPLRESVRTLLGALLILLFQPPWLSAQELARTLDDPHLPAIEVLGGTWTPDSSGVIYRVDMDLRGRTEIHSRPAGSDEPVVLATDLLYPTATPSADSAHVVYRFNYDPERDNALYSIPIGGGEPLVLHGPVDEGGAIGSAYALADNRMIYWAAQSAEDNGALYLVPATGGTPIRLTPEMTGTWRISGLLLTSDLSTLVYARNRGQAEHLEIYSIPLSGGAPTLLVSSPEPSGRIFDFRVSPDGSRVIYRVRHDATYGQLHSVPIDGSTAPVKISSTSSGSYGVSRDYWITSDSQRVVYDATASSTRRMLHSVPIAGGAITVLRDMAVDPTYRNSGLARSNDTALFIASRNLQSLPATGGVPSPLSTIDTAGGFVQDYLLNPAEDRIVYRADATVEGRLDLYSVPVTGGTPVQLNDPAVDPSGIDDWQGYTVTSTHVYFERNGRIAATPIDGGSDVVLSGPLADSAEIGFRYPSPDGQSLLYLSSEDSPAATELYRVEGDGGPSVRLSAEARQRAGRVSEYRLSPDGQWIAFLADRDVTDHYELYLSRIADGTVVKLNPPLDLGREIGSDFAFTPDGSEVFFRLESSFRSWDLWAASVPANKGSAEGLEGDGVLRRLVDDVDGSVDAFQVLSDGTQLRFLADSELRRQFVAGGVSQVIDGYVGDIWNFWITPDESTLVFEGLDPGSVTERLYALPIDGGPETLVNRGGAAASRFRNLRFSPDSQWILFQFSSSSILRLVSIDGQVHLVPDGSSFGAVFTPDSQYLLMLNGSVVRYPVGTEDGTDLFDLDALGARWARSFVLTGTGQVVAVLEDDTTFEDSLVSVPVTGGEPTPLGDLAAYDITDLRAGPTGERVYFAVREDSPSGYGLWTAPTTGGSPQPLLGGQRGTFLGASSDDRWVFYTLPGDGSYQGPLYVESTQTGTPSLLTPADWLTQSDLTYSPQHGAVFFRAEQHDLRTGLHTSSVADFALFVDGFESGNTSAWSNGS